MVQNLTSFSRIEGLNRQTLEVSTTSIYSLQFYVSTTLMCSLSTFHLWTSVRGDQQAAAFDLSYLIADLQLDEIYEAATNVGRSCVQNRWYWICLAPCMPPEKLVKSFARIHSWHSGSQADFKYSPVLCRRRIYTVGTYYYITVHQGEWY